MRTFFSSITAVLCCICGPVIAFTCDSSFIKQSGITFSGTPIVNHVSQGTNIKLNAGSGCPTSIAAGTDMCRVALNVPTSSSSEIYMELWLPDNWEGRYVSTGNFGLAGCVLYSDLQYLSSLNVAVAGANGGYFGGPPTAFSNIEVVTDYSFRSVHNMTNVAKQLTKSYYNIAANNSYYFGCSTGGRQGLQSAQMFPGDFDGIIASSAAADFNGLTGWSGLPFPTTGTGGSSKFVNETQWSAIAAAVMGACDTIDGVPDGIIEDPDLCNFDPKTLACGKGSNSPSNCLNESQLKTVTTVLGDLRDSSGNLLYPRMQPGVEKDAFSTLYAGNPNLNPTGWYANAIFHGQNYDPAQLDISDVILGESLDLASISTFKADLSAFKNGGGKLITLHGLADSVITSTNSVRYYKLVSATMNLSPDDLDDFYRYFRISGMQHCSNGPGAWEVGLTGSHVPNDAQHNVVFALFDWVENGNAPDTLLGTKFNNDDVSQGISFSRNHCRYPYRTTFTGGDSTKPESWNCTAITNTAAPLLSET